MTKFFGLQSVILGISLMTFFGVPNKHHYLAASQDKKRILEDAPSPRMIIIGDSGGAYGICSPILQERFPDYHVVNMALMAAVGLPSMLAEVHDELRPGDVVIMVLAYQHYDRYVPSWEYFTYLSYRPDMMFTKPLREVPELCQTGYYLFNRAIKGMLRTITKGPHVPRKPPLHREGFNKYGDLVAHYTMTPPGNIDFSMADLTFSRPRYSKAVLKDLNQFNVDAKAKGAQVYLLFPAISTTTWEENGEVIREISDYVVENIDYPILNQPQDVIYPEEDFFDTFYHLTGEAAQRRTTSLAEDLEPYIQP
ncbi:hypothetical protein ACFFOV_04620 [Cerasicoccus arenae]